VREIGIADLWLPAARPSASDGHPGCRGHDEGSLTVGPVFEPLREVAFFALATVDSETGTVVWPNGADLAPDVLHTGTLDAVSVT
jgi:hypothetical protein